jgi:hypothetical protein
MSTYHICYLIQGLREKLCTGKNIAAKSYNDALEEFEKQFGKQEILYIKNNSSLAA